LAEEDARKGFAYIESLTQISRSLMSLEKNLDDFKAQLTTEETCSDKRLYEDGLYAIKHYVGYKMGQKLELVPEIRVFPKLKKGSVEVNYTTSKGTVKRGFLEPSTQIIHDKPCGSSLKAVFLPYNGTHKIIITNGSLKWSSSIRTNVGIRRILQLGGIDMAQSDREVLHQLSPTITSEETFSKTEENGIVRAIKDWLAFDLMIWIVVALCTVLIMGLVFVWWCKRGPNSPVTIQFPEVAFNRQNEQITIGETTNQSPTRRSFTAQTWLQQRSIAKGAGPVCGGRLPPISSARKQTTASGSGGTQTSSQP